MAAADLHSAVLEMFAGLEADERLAGQGLAEAFAEAFPAVPAASAVPSLSTSTSWARVAALLGVSSLSILDVTQANAKEVPAARKVLRLTGCSRVCVFLRAVQLACCFARQARCSIMGASLP